MELCEADTSLELICRVNDRFSVYNQDVYVTMHENRKNRLENRKIKR